VGIELLTERYKSRIAGTLSYYDRIIIQGTLPKWCYAQGMTEYSTQTRFASSTTPSGQSRCGTRFGKTWRASTENGIEIEFVRSKKSFRKEQRVVWKLGRLLVAPSLLTE